MSEKFMYNLNKENFWNAMHEECPQAVEKFCVWIDEYKEIVCWRLMFGDKVKFHDLPYEMQMGIMNRFFIETFADKEEYLANGGRVKQYHSEMRETIRQVQKRIIEGPIDYKAMRVVRERRENQ